MTEQEWLTSPLAQKMLDHIEKHLPYYSRRKMYLLVEVATKVIYPRIRLVNSFAESVGINEHARPEYNRQEWIVNEATSAKSFRLLAETVHEQRPKEYAQLADLMREIFGNPFKQVQLPRPVIYEGVGAPSSSTATPTLTKVYGPCPWLTPTVVSLAKVAYDERPGKMCNKCNGVGKEWDGRGGDGWFSCSTCHGTGRIEDGQLDPHLLNVLADALTDAGCNNEELVRHLRGEERCPRAHWPAHPQNMTEAYTQVDPTKVQTSCVTCKSTGYIPLCCPHYRGCWVVDLILGHN